MKQYDLVLHVQLEDTLGYILAQKNYCSRIIFQFLFFFESFQ